MYHPLGRPWVLRIAQAGGAGDAWAGRGQSVPLDKAGWMGWVFGSSVHGIERARGESELEEKKRARERERERLVVYWVAAIFANAWLFGGTSTYHFWPVPLENERAIVLGQL